MGLIAWVHQVSLSGANCFAREDSKLKMSNGQDALHHDNAPSHTAFAVMDFMIKHGATELPQPPCSADVAPSDFFLFPRLKRFMKGRHRGSVQAIQEALTRELKSVPVSAFQGAFSDRQSRWKRCVDAEGVYFENC